MKGKRSLSLIFHKISTEGLNVSTVPINEVLVYFRNLETFGKFITGYWKYSHLKYTMYLFHQ